MLPPAEEYAQIINVNNSEDVKPSTTTSYNHKCSLSKEYKEGKNQNTLNPESIEKTIKAYGGMQDIEKFMRIVDLEEIKENDYNLNIARYIDTSSEEEIINIENVINKIVDIEEKEKEIDTKLNEYLKTLGFMS
jgi:type I restriction enzyme M protein